MRPPPPALILLLVAPVLTAGQCQYGTVAPGDVTIGSFNLTATQLSDRCGLLSDAGVLNFSAKFTGQTDAGAANGAALFTRSLGANTMATEVGVYVRDDAGLAFVVCGSSARMLSAGAAQVSEAIYGRLYDEAETSSLGGACPQEPPIAALANGCLALNQGQPVPGAVPTPSPGQAFPLLCGQIKDSITCLDGGWCAPCPFDGGPPEVIYDLVGVGSQP